MYLCISGFLVDSTEDDSIKFELVVDRSHNEKIVQLLGHESLNAMAECEWPLTMEQVETLSNLIGHDLPTSLKLYIGVEA